MTTLSQVSAEQLQLARARLGLALLLLGCAALTWVPGSSSVRLLPLFVRYTALAAAAGAMQGALRLRSRLQPEPGAPAREQVEPEPAAAPPSRPLIQQREKVVFKVSHLPQHFPAPHLTPPLAATLPAWTAYLPESWEAQTHAGGVLVSRDALPPLLVSLSPPLAPEVTGVHWIPDESTPAQAAQPTSFGWQVRGNALQLVQILEVL